MLFDARDNGNSCTTLLQRGNTVAPVHRLVMRFGNGGVEKLADSPSARRLLFWSDVSHPPFAAEPAIMTPPTSPPLVRPILILVTAIAAVWFSGRASGDELPLAYDGQSLFYHHDVYGRSSSASADATATATRERERRRQFARDGERAPGPGGWLSDSADVVLRWQPPASIVSLRSPFSSHVVPPFHLASRGDGKSSADARLG